MAARGCCIFLLVFVQPQNSQHKIVTTNIIWSTTPGTGQAQVCVENHHKQRNAPYVIYADFESIVQGPILDPSKSDT